MLNGNNLRLERDRLLLRTMLKSDIDALQLIFTDPNVMAAFNLPLTQLTLSFLGYPAGLPKAPPMNQLAMQVAFIAPLSLPLIGVVALYNLNWFYPAFTLVLGTHYMPFIFLYGMWEFGLLSALLIGGGVAIGMILPDTFAVGGWFTGVVLLLFALIVQITPKFSK